MKNKLQGIIIALFAIVILGFGGVAAANATTQQKITVCHATGSKSNPYTVITVDANGYLNGHPTDFLYTGPVDIHGHTSASWCVDHKPQPTPTPIPTIVPTATPTPKVDCDKDHDHDHNWDWKKKCEEPTPTPTQKPCVVWDGEFPMPCPSPMVTPTPTATPEATVTPGPGNVPSNPHTDTIEAPVCSDGSTTNLPANVFVVRNGSQAIVNGFITEGDSANIYWKESSEGSWTNSSAATNPDGVKPNGLNFISYTINDLKVGVDYDFGFQQKFGCGGGQTVTAVVHDGDNFGIIFRITSYKVN